jgi:predicted oxidoreductase
MVDTPMAHYPLATFIPNASPLIYGCMGLGGGWNSDAITAEDLNQANGIIDTALENGINYFDHADIYTLGKAEQVFGMALKQRPQLRENMIIQTKCGIRFEDNLGPKRYDLSAQWITHSVNNSLKQLNCDYLDVLLLHRPDPLMQPEEIATAFDRLRNAGKVHFLGVSNMQQHQINALQQALDEPLVINQVEMSLRQHDWIDEGVYAGNKAGNAVNFTPGMLAYCGQQGLQIQAWGSLCQGIYTGKDVTNESLAVQQTSQLVSRLAIEYSASPEAIVLSWLMRHPAAIQPVIGTSNKARIKACTQARRVNLSREDWYALYVSVKGEGLP